MSWMRMMLPPRRMTPPMGGQSGVPTGPGIPSGVSAPEDTGFFDGAGLPQIDYSHLDDNVIMPHSVFGSSRIARGLDNALLSLATMKPSQTLGEGISNVASNVLGLEPEREQLNLSRQMSPYLSMEPLLKMKSEMSDMDYRSALSEHARAMADYYRAGGRAMRPEVKQLADGTFAAINPDNTATPITMNGQPVKGQVRGTGNTLIDRVIAKENADRVAQGLPEYNAQEFGDRVSQLWHDQFSAETSGRNQASPKFTDIEAKKNKAFAKAEEDAQGEVAKLKPPSNPLDPEYMTAMQNPNAWLQQKKNDIYSRLNQTKSQIQSDYEADIAEENRRLGRGGSGFAPVPQGGPVDIPQPIVPPAGPGYVPQSPQPQGQPINIGGVPGMAVGVTPQQVAQAIVPPGPKASPAPASKSTPAARSGRPKVSIAPDGTIHVE